MLPAVLSSNYPRTRNRSYLVFFTILIFVSLLLSAGCADDDLQPALKNTSQNALTYLDASTENNVVISEAKQQIAMQNYLGHYFSPWTGKKQLLPLAEVKQNENEQIQDFITHIYWRENQAQFPSQWIKTIAANMSLTTFPNHQYKAITLFTDSLRTLPTNEPAFETKMDYPFDLLQESLINANTPILVLHTTKDGAWSLVLASSVIGWLPSRDIASVDSSFMEKWQTTKFVITPFDNLPIITQDQRFVFRSRIGALYPLDTSHATPSTGGNNPDYSILVAVADSNQHAVIQTAKLNRSTAAIWPLTATQRNMALMVNQIMGMPYGWGGMYEFRDCSSTMQDLFAMMGIWLPRGSSVQLSNPNAIDMDYNNATKEKIIREQGIPFFTLLGVTGHPGHVMLYIGNRNNKLYVFHEKWALHTWKPFGPDGRAHLGAAVITPLTLGQGYLNIKKSLIDIVYSMYRIDPSSQN